MSMESARRPSRELGSKCANVSVAATFTAQRDAQTFRCLRVSAGDPSEDSLLPGKPSPRAGAEIYRERTPLQRKEPRYDQVVKEHPNRIGDRTHAGMGQRQSITDQVRYGDFDSPVVLIVVQTWRSVTNFEPQEVSDPKHEEATQRPC